MKKILREDRKYKYRRTLKMMKPIISQKFPRLFRNIPEVTSNQLSDWKLALPT